MSVPSQQTPQPHGDIIPMSTAANTDAWLEAVDLYFKQLADTLDQVNYCAAMFIEHTSAGQFGALAESSQQLLAATQQLESLLETRTQILLAATREGEERPRSLRSALRRVGDSHRGQLAEDLAKQVADARQKAVALFVTQFHLFETTDVIMRTLLRKGPDVGSYGRAPKESGGGLLDDAA